MDRLPSIVQFTHPGWEHGPDSVGGSHKSWNKGPHRRKFMSANGDYVDANGKVISDACLNFWGEWEPPSRAIDLGGSSDKFHPRWLHFPYLPSEIPSGARLALSTCTPPTSSERSCASVCEPGISMIQNTDPFVFGECFKYFVCKQSKRGMATKMAALNAGSVILFGSTAGRTKGDAFFQLDTVFVIAEHLEYRPCDPGGLPQHPSITSDYLKASFQMAFPKPEPSIPADLRLRLYLGATATNPIHGMYSFVPARLAGAGVTGFPRVPLKNLPYLTNNLNSAPKITDCTETEAFQFWREIREISRNHGCVEGVRFSYGTSPTQM